MVDLLDEGSWNYILNLFKKVTIKYDEKCFKRKRVLDSSMLVFMIVSLTQSKNNQGYATVINDFWLKAQRLIPGLSSRKPLAKSSFSDARSKLDPTIFKELNQAVVKKSNKPLHLWNGHRVFAVDGSKINLPRQLLDEGFAPPNPQSYYPQGLISCLYDLKGKVPFDFMLSSDRDERACAYEHLTCLSAGNVVVYDRGYQCYELLYRHLETGIHAVMRMETTTTFNAVKSFVNRRNLDETVTFTPAAGSLGKIRKRSPCIEIKPLQVRLIKYKVKNKLYVLATTLLNKRQYPRKIFLDLYHSRWSIEEMYKTLKNDVGINNFHGKSRKKVEQEIYAAMLLMTIARLFSNSTKAEKSTSKKFQIN